MASKIYRKFRKVTSSGFATGTSLHFGKFGIKAIESGRLNASQIESARKVLSRTVRKFGGTVYVCIFPHLPVTKKPAEVRMGGGKGAVAFNVANIKLGQVIFEFDGFDDINVARNCVTSVAAKLPLKLNFIFKKFVNL